MDIDVAKSKTLMKVLATCLQHKSGQPSFGAAVRQKLLIILRENSVEIAEDSAVKEKEEEDMADDLNVE